MKKFDLRKWMNEQKALPKKKRTLKSDSPVIRNKKKLTEAQKLLTEQAGYTQALDWWNALGFNGGLQATNSQGKLYVCDGSGNINTYDFSSADDPSSSGYYLQNSLHSLQTGGSFATLYLNNAGSYAFGSVGWAQLNGRFITPVDVVHYCLQYPNQDLIIDSNGSTTLSCALMHGGDPSNPSPCGGMWVGDANGDAFNPSPTGNNLNDGSPQSAPNNGWYQGLITPGLGFGWGLTSPGTWTNYGIPSGHPGTTDDTNTSIGTATNYYTPALIGEAGALNNCQGPNGACDNNWYVFGCADTNSINYNDSSYYNPTDGSSLSDTNGITYLDNTFSTTLSSFYGGITSTQADSNSYLWSLDAATGIWTQGSTTVAGSGGDNAGCGVNGEPVDTNYDCCQYAGCPSVSSVSFPIINYGIWDPQDGTTAITSGTIDTNVVNTDSAFINQHSSIIGCPDSNNGFLTPNFADQTSCCKIVGCPTVTNAADSNGYAGRSTMVFQGGNQQKQEPEGWTNFGANPYDSNFQNTAIIGCDTLDMVTNGTGLPTGIPDPNDFSCCEPIMPTDPDVGCRDSAAANFNIHIETGLPIAAAGCRSTINTWEADSDNFDCCNYAGCPDANIHVNHDNGPVAINAAAFDITTGINPNITYDQSDLISVNSGMTGDIYQMASSTFGTFGCTDINGNVLISNFSCCTYPDYGCPDSNAHNYVDTNTGGCSIDTNINGVPYSVYAVPASQIDSNTSCCDYLGCFEPSVSSMANNFGPTTDDSSTLPPYQNILPLSGIDVDGYPNQYQNIGGNPGCLSIANGGDTNLEAIYASQTTWAIDCCSISGCTDPGSTNFDPNANFDDGSCTFGGCMDDATGWFWSETAGASIEYYLASNYNPLATECDGSLTSTACCKYYTCDDIAADNYNYTPDVTSFFLGNNSVSFNYDPASTQDVGCPPENYDISLVASHDFSADPDGLWDGGPLAAVQSNWCCAYKGCSHEDARNFDASVVPLYSPGVDDPKDFYWGCNVDIMHQANWFDSNISYNCCQYSGCSDITDTNIDTAVLFDIVNEVFMPLYGTASPTGWDTAAINAFYYTNITCEPGFENNIGVDYISNNTEYSCCNYEGCTDQDAANSINITQGTGGCNGTVGDGSCCKFFGCPDSIANNFGVFLLGWNNPSVVGSAVAPGGGEFGCSVNGDDVIMDSANSNYEVCCSYNVGCSDPLAVAGVPLGNNSYGVDCPGCNYDSNALACFADSTGFPSSTVYPIGWASGTLDDGLQSSPFPPATAFGILDSNVVTWDNGTSHPGCCVYQLGCSDPAGQGYVAGNIGCESQNVAGTPAADDQTGFDSNNPIHECCFAPLVFGCPDGQQPANNYDSAAFCCEDSAIPGQCSQTSWLECCDYTGKYSCDDPSAIKMEFNNLSNTTTWSSNNTQNSWPLYTLYTHTFSGILQSDYITNNNITLSNDQPIVSNGGQSPYWCFERYANILGNPSDPTQQLDIIHPGCHNYMSIGCDGVGYPGSGISDQSCCVYDYACPIQGSDSYNADQTAGYSGAGCSADAGLQLSDPAKFIGEPDIDDESCCRWTDSNEIGCSDSNAYNYLATAIGCQQNTSTAPVDSNKSCCQYVYGCTHANSISQYYFATVPGPHGSGLNAGDHFLPTPQGCAPGSTNLTSPGFDVPVDSNYDCCEFTYGCHKTEDSNLASGSPGFGIPYIISTLLYNPSHGYHADHNGCNPQDFLNFTPASNEPIDTNECCLYQYGCADSNSQNYDPAAGMHYGCDPTDQLNDIGIYPPLDSNLSCCGDYTYNCVDPNASNYYLNVGGTNPYGCADTNNVSYNNVYAGTAGVDPAPNVLNSNCCTYTYACADTNAAIDPRWDSMTTTNSANPGCNPDTNVDDITISYTNPDQSHHACCTYLYGCADPTANSLGVAAYCVTPPGYIGPFINNSIDCITAGGAWLPSAQLGCNPNDPSNTTPSNVTPVPSADCCMYEYGCLDSNASPCTGGIVSAPGCYDSANKGCHPGSDTNGLAGAFDPSYPSTFIPYREQLIQYNLEWNDNGTNVSSLPNTNNTSCCKYEYNCDHPLSMTYDSADPVRGCNPDTAILTPNFSYPDTAVLSCCEFQYGCLDSNATVNYDSSALGCDSSTSVNYQNYDPVTGFLISGIGSTPPSPTSFACCDYGCGDTNYMGTTSYHPIAFDASLLVGLSGVTSLLDYAEDYWNAPSGPVLIPPPENSICCVDTEASGYQAGNAATYTYAYVPTGGNATNDCTDCSALDTTDPNRYVQVGCEDDEPICDKCCLNLALAMASNGQAFGYISQFDATNIQAAVASSTDIEAYDENNQATWEFYQVPAYIYLQPTNPANVPNNGCACTDPNGNAISSIIEIDCWSGWAIDCSPPCLDTNDPSAVSPYDSAVLNSQLGAILASLYGASFAGTGLDANCGCHIYDSNYLETDCGPTAVWDPTPVMCPSIMVWDSASCGCDYPCPRDWCWCYNPDPTILDTAVDSATAWCCGDPTTGIITEMDPGGTYPEQQHYTLIYPEDNPAGIWTLQNNWLGCPTVQHAQGTTSFGIIDSEWGSDVSNEGGGSTNFSTSPTGTPQGPFTIPANPDQFIVPCEAACDTPYNEDRDIVNPYNDFDFPVAFWKCGCPDIHNNPFPNVSGNDYFKPNPAAMNFPLYGQNALYAPDHLFQAGDPIDMTDSEWSHEWLGCPFNNQPNTIPYTSAGVLQNFLAGNPSPSTKDGSKFNCCMPEPPQYGGGAIYGCNHTNYINDITITDDNGNTHNAQAGDPIQTNTMNYGNVPMNDGFVFSSFWSWDAGAFGCPTQAPVLTAGGWDYGPPDPNDESCCVPDFGSGILNPCSVEIMNGKTIQNPQMTRAYCGKCQHNKFQQEGAYGPINGTGEFAPYTYFPAGGNSTPPTPNHPNGLSPCDCDICDDYCAGRGQVFASLKGMRSGTFPNQGTPSTHSDIHWVRDITNGPGTNEWGKDFKDINWTSGPHGTIFNVESPASNSAGRAEWGTDNGNYFGLLNIAAWEYVDYYCKTPTGTSLTGNASNSMANPNSGNQGEGKWSDVLKQLNMMSGDDYNLPMSPESCKAILPSNDDKNQGEVNNSYIVDLLNKQIDKTGDDAEAERMQQQLNYFEELISYCNTNVFKDDNEPPEFCSELPLESPFLDVESDECIRCNNSELSSDHGKVQLDKEEPISKEEPIGEQESDERPIGDDNLDTNVREINYCACCPPPLERIPDPNDSNIMTTRPVELPTKPLEPGTEPEVEPEVAPEKTPEELEYERKTAEYERKKADLLSKGWTEGNPPVINPEEIPTGDPIPEYETKTLKNQDDENVIFHRIKPEDPVTPDDNKPGPDTTDGPLSGPLATPDDFTLPTDPIPVEPPIPISNEPKITTSELKQIVKNVIKEIKNKR